MKKSSAQNGRLSPLVLNAKSASAKDIAVAVAALSRLVGNHGSERTLTTNQHFEFGRFEETVLTISPRNTARGISMRFVLSVTRSRPKDPALRRRALMLEKSKKSANGSAKRPAKKSRSANGKADRSQKDAGFRNGE